MNEFSNSNLFNRYPVLEKSRVEIAESFQMLKDTFENGGKLLIAGNGGSSADAEHLCGELVKGFLQERPLSERQAELYNRIDENLVTNLQNGLPAFSLGVSHSLISAFANDMNPVYVYAQQVHVMANVNDALFVISTSGNSKNIVEAVKVAKAKEILTIGLTGERESKVSELADVTIKVPGRITHEVQELHLPVYHALCIELENHFFT